MTSRHNDYLAGWRDAALCARLGPPWWDEDVDGETPAAREARHAHAAAICADCPVRVPCADDVDWRLDTGIRGGHLLPPYRAKARPVAERRAA